MTIRIDDDRPLTADEAWALVTGEGEEAAETEPADYDPIDLDGPIQEPPQIMDEEEPASDPLHDGPPPPAAAKETGDPAKVLAARISDMKCEDNDTACKEELKGLLAERRRLVPLLMLSGTMNSFAMLDAAGAPIERRVNSFGISFDWLSKNYDNGLRVLAGAYYRGYKDNMAAGARIGFGADIAERIFFKMPFGLGWINAGGVDDDASGVPIELSGTGVNADQTAYTMQPRSVEMSMHAASLSVEPEINFVFHRWHIGGGKTLSLGAFLAISAGLYLGSLRDDDCSYAYDPSEGGLEVRPTGQGSYEFTSSGQLSSRCRDSETAFGTIFGGSAGLTLELGL